jgi:hypothetical protein
MLKLRFARDLRTAAMFLILAACVLSAAAYPVQAAPEATTRYVAPSGLDSGSCTLSAPCRSLQYAVNKAVSGDNIFVAGGTYTYNAANDTCTFLTTRAVVCVVNKTLRVVGGFSTSNWAVPVPGLNPTTIDGQNSRRGVSLTSYNGVARVTMENFTIQNGYAKGASSGGDYFTYAAGGGMDSTTGSVVLTNVVFRNNRSVGGDIASGYGGGGIGGGLTIRSSPGGAISTLTNVRFEGNTAQGGNGPERGGVAQGGGFFIDNATVIAKDLQFSGNQALAASAPGSGLSNGLHADALGGAIALGANANANFDGLYVTNSYCLGGNGTTYGGNCFGGGIYAENNSTLTLAHGVLSHNTAVGGNGTTGGGAFGGAIATYDANAALSQTRLVENLCQGGVSTNSTKKGPAAGGGAIFIADAAPHQASLTNGVIAYNRIQLSGNGTDPGLGGAGVALQGIQSTITHSTIAYNTFGTTGFLLGQGLYVLSTGGGRAASLALNYSIVASHTNSANAAALHVSPNNSATLTRSLFAANTSNSNVALGGMLTAATAGFRNPTDLRLTASSAARDTADNSPATEDVVSFPRPYGAKPDIGAYEYNPQVPRIYIPAVVR